MSEGKSNHQVSTSGRSGVGGQGNATGGQPNHQDRYAKSAAIKDSKDQRGDKDHRVEVIIFIVTSCAMKYFTRSYIIASIKY